jgi:hypothetical protein
MATSIPRKDEAFDAFVEPIMEWLIENLEDLDLDQEFITKKVIPAWRRWQKAYAKCRNKTKRTHEDVVEKDAARFDLEKKIRKVIASMKGSSIISEAQLKKMFIATGKKGAPNLPPTTQVDLYFDLRASMRVLVTARAHAAESKARPEGTMGVEYRWKIGGEHVTDHNALPMVSIITNFRTPLVIEVEDEALRNEEVQVTARFLSTRGEPGPWCVIYRVRIP